MKMFSWPTASRISMLAPYEANGEDNRDGPQENYSANYGVEGESGDPAVEAERQRQIKNFLLTLAISRGVPSRCHAKHLHLAAGAAPRALATCRRYVPSLAARLLRPRGRSRPRKPDELRRRITLERGSGRALSASHPSPG